MPDAEFKAALDCHSHGMLRVTVRHVSSEFNSYVVAKIHGRHEAEWEAAVRIFLHTPEEIAAWRVLSEALAAADVRESAA